MKDLINLIKKRKREVISIVLVIVILASVFTALQPFKYSTKTKLLIYQSGSSVDPYTISKSNEYLSNLFVKVIHSTSFIGLVKSSDFDIDSNYFESDLLRMTKKWKKDVRVQSFGDSGMIAITVYGEKKYQSRQITLAISEVLKSQNTNYQGIGDSVIINTIDEPITSNYYTSPNIFINLFGALALGFLLSLLYISIFPNNKTKSKTKMKKGSNKVNVDIIKGDRNTENEDKNISKLLKEQESREGYLDNDHPVSIDDRR